MQIEENLFTVSFLRYSVRNSPSPNLFDKEISFVNL